MHNAVQPPPSKHLSALDGLRGIAVLLVTIWHYIPFLHPFFPGWAGVDLFFVLSGYLITGRLLDTMGQPDYFSGFYGNRALRILPLYYALVIPFFIAICFVGKEHQPTIALYKDHWLSFLLFFQNWTFVFFGFPRDISLVHLWSLAVEEQFYLVWPLIILLIHNSRLRMQTLTLLLPLILLTRTSFYLYYPHQGTGIYCNTFFRMDSLIAGSLLCHFHRSTLHINTRWIKQTAAISLILIVSFILTKNASPFNALFLTAGFTLLAVFFTCILHLVLQPGMLSRFCSLPLLRFFGKISYGLYMFQVPVWMFIGNRLLYNGQRWWPHQASLLSWIVPLFCFLLSLLISIISFYYFESFFLRLKNRKIYA